MPLLRTLTLGCKVNRYETEYVRQGLLRAGYHDAGEGEQADLCVVNTCTVTLEGDYKSRKLIRQLARENPCAEIIVMGCYATRAPQEVAALPGVVDVVTDKGMLPELLARFGVEAPRGIESFPGLHRAFVKVQDGCSMACSYCIVPQVRPVLWSRPADQVLDEVRRLVAHGHREIVLTGIHLGHYSGGVATLVRQILALEGDFRLRLSSLEASEVAGELLALMAERPDRFCPHLHLPMQSGSDAVLSRMRRPWPIGRFIDRCQEIRRLLDRPALTTDVIVGFPGETDADFAATCRAVEEAGFSRVHVFRFSARDGTAAATMPGQLPPELKHYRASELADISLRLCRRYCVSLLDSTLSVMVESAVPGNSAMLVGTSDRYVSVEIPWAEGLLDRVIGVQATAVVGDHLQGIVAAPPA